MILTILGMEFTIDTVGDFEAFQMRSIVLMRFESFVALRSMNNLDVALSDSLKVNPLFKSNHDGFVTSKIFSYYYFGNYKRYVRTIWLYEVTLYFFK